MCILVGEEPIERVSGTNIFARASAASGQILVYSMSLRAPRDVAMILPLPVPKDAPEDAVRFISLESYADFFEAMDSGFPRPVAAAASGDLEWECCVLEAPLEVHEVGDFEASYVPSHDDWERLDPRFRLPPAVWGELPVYHDYGFAVFQLKSTAASSGDVASREIHPMAFEFPRRDPERLFFPTVHVHDGTLHETATFDHTLYCQGRAGDAEPGLGTLGPIASELPHRGWGESEGPASSFMHLDRASGTLLPEAPCFKLELRQSLPNRDLFF